MSHQHLYLPSQRFLMMPFFYFTHNVQDLLVVLISWQAHNKILEVVFQRIYLLPSCLISEPIVPLIMVAFCGFVMKSSATPELHTCKVLIAGGSHRSKSFLRNLQASHW